MSAVPPLRFAVLGTADIAWRRMLPAMAALPESRVSVVASRRPERAARFAERFGARVAADYESALRRDDVDAVYIPLPNALHEPWAERALLAGLHVLVEKPLAGSAGAVTRLQSLARSRGLVLRENMMFVHHSQHATFRRLVGRMGAPLSFSAAFTVPPRPAGDIRLRAELGGGALLDTGVYPIRAAVLHLGADLEVLAAVLRLRGVDVGGSALLLSPDGVTAQLEWGFDQPYRCHYETIGAAGRLRLERAFTPPPDHVPVARLTGCDGGREELEFPPDDQFQAVLRDFCAQVVTGRREDPDSLAAARLLDRISDVARRVPSR